jgi:hypothetical protein
MWHAAHDAIGIFEGATMSHRFLGHAPLSLRHFAITSPPNTNAAFNERAAAKVAIESKHTGA